MLHARIVRFDVMNTVAIFGKVFGTKHGHRFPYSHSRVGSKLGLVLQGIYVPHIHQNRPAKNIGCMVNEMGGTQPAIVITESQVCRRISVSTPLNRFTE